jgi:hypothetical protein
LLASELAHATDGFRLLPHSSLRGLLVEAPLFHLAKDALTLHPLLEDAQRLIHIVVAHENLQLALRSWLGFEYLLARFLRFTSHAGLRGAMSYLRWIPAPRPFPTPPAAATQPADHLQPSDTEWLLADYTRVEAIALAIALRRTAVSGSAEIELAVYGLRRACCWLCPLLA